MSTTDEARLDAIDRRARAAARTLLDDLASHSAATPVTDPPGPPEPAVIRLDGPGPDGHRTRHRTRRWKLAAAAVAVLALAGGAVAVVTRDDGGADVTSQGRLDYLLPGWLPLGFEPAAAVDLARAPTDDSVDGEIAVYGDPEADDPWHTTLTVMRLAVEEDSDLQLGPQSPDLSDSPTEESVTVAGHEATLSRTEDPSGQESGWQVEWPVEGGRLQVAGALGRDAVLAAAESATEEPAIGASGLPGGFAELARGPLEAAAPGLFEAGASRTGLGVAYSAGAGSDEAQSTVAVFQRPGPASAVDLLRGTYPDSEAITVRGRRAVVGRAQGDIAVQWAEPEGQLVTVVGIGLAEDAVLRVVEGLRPATAAEIDALLDEHGVAAGGEFGDAPDGHVVVAEGDTPSGRWRVTADATRPPGLDALTIERVSDSTSSSGSASGTGGDGAAEPPALELSSDTEDGVTIVYGLVPEGATSVTYEAPGVVGALDVHAVDGWDAGVVAVDITAELPSDVAADVVDAVTVIARGGDGRELGRQTIAVEHDPFPPDGEQPSDLVEECAMLPDGSEQCSYSDAGVTTDTIPADG